MTNQLIYDNAGIPSIMVPVKKFLLSDVIDGAPDVPHPAFIVCGCEVPEIFISKYQNIVVGERAYSAQAQQPQTNIAFDEAVHACEKKGPGWHLMSRAEWAAIALWCKRNGTLPRGNNDRGHDYSERGEKGITYDGYRVLTGSGPASWAHDHTVDGIYDLNGNVWEWQGGLRWLDGEVQIIPDNDTAAGADQSPDSPDWSPVMVNGKAIRYKVKDDKIKLTTKCVPETWGGFPFSETKAKIEVPIILKALALFPDGKHETEEYFWIDTSGERLSYAGGAWTNGSSAGVFSLIGNAPRSASSTNLGFRAAFIPPEN